jgi:hypothetical protein
MAKVSATDVVDGRTTARTFSWSPAQVIAALIGIGYIVLGAIGLARTGFNVHHVTTPPTTVWRWHQTPILGLIELGYGALMVVAALRPAVAKTVMGLLSLAAVGLGITVLIDAFPQQLHVWLGVTRANAWLYVGTGVLGLLAAMASPTFFHARRQRRSHRHVTA